MNSSKPYIIRALHEWVVDNQCTPHILVAIDFPGVEVPEGYGENGQLVLNLSPTAVRGLSITNEAIHFEARFGGVPQTVYVPIAAVLALYAKENGQGMFFEPEPVAEEQSLDSELQDMGDTPATEPKAAPSPAGTRPNLRVVK